MNNNEVVIVNTVETSAYSFCAPCDANTKLREAREYAKTWGDECTRRIDAYPSMAEYWRNQAARYQMATYEAMSWEQFAAIEREKLLSGRPQEITRERYDEMLDVLPPLHYGQRNGVEEFCMREMYTGTYSEQYARDYRTGKYWCKMVDVCDPSTWLHNILSGNE